MSSRDDHDEALGHLTVCRIGGLFGDRNITFDTVPNGPTLLFGTNGTGKSTILRLVDDIAHARWLSVFEVPFGTVDLRFSGGSQLTIDKRHDAMYLRLDDEAWTFDSEMHHLIRRRTMAHNRRRVEAGRAATTYGQTTLFTEEELAQLPRWTTTLPARFPVLLIGDQRLILKARTRRQAAPTTRPQPWQDSAVSRYPMLLKQEMDSAFSAYGTRAQELDHRFPMKLADAVEQQESDGEPPGATKELRNLLAAIRAEREALERVGLLGQDEELLSFDARRLETARVRPVIRAFAEDEVAKYSVMRDLRVRLELFSSFLNEHYHGKRVLTSRADGFVLLLADRGMLEPWQLSSGEQQVLALAFQILFVSEPGTLILIDEPELSLHVLWQSTLIDNLVAMGEARDVSFILATHSPTLIGDRTELMRPLDQIAASLNPSEPLTSTVQIDFFDDEDEDEADVDVETLLDSTDLPSDQS